MHFPTLCEWGHAQELKPAWKSLLRVRIVDVDVDTGVNVVEQIPADVVGIFIDSEIVTAIPAPIGANRPVPGCRFKEETTGEPRAVMIKIETLDAIVVRRAKVLESPVLVKMVEMVALVVGAVVAIPVVTCSRAAWYSCVRLRGAQARVLREDCRASGAAAEHGPD
jgi:hypothetical protein